MKESHESMKLLLGKNQYDEFKWNLCCDLKVVALLLGMQLGKQNTAVSCAKQVDLKYVGRLFLDTEEGCIWLQIPAKVICLYILEESLYLFHEHVKYYFAHLNSSVPFKPCLIEIFCVHIGIQHKMYC
jgi:hypothetical protein